MKLYRFYDKRGVSVDIEAETILDAKGKVEELGLSGFVFCRIITLS